MSWLDYIIISILILGLCWLFVIALVRFLGMIKNVDD
jgi:hypothetical protein